MPSYLYRCKAGHVSEQVRPVDQRNLRRRCQHAGCKLRSARDSMAEIGTIGDHTLPEIPAHYNMSLDCHVEGRKHLEHLQKKHGFRDYSPTDRHHKAPPTTWQ